MPEPIAAHNVAGLPFLRKAQCACGGGCPNCLANAGALKIGQPNDSAEIEADRIADRAMRMPAGTSVDTAREGSAAVARVGSSAGEPLDANTRGFFEPRLRADLGGVRVHTGSAAAQSARALNARAYTLGSDIVFGQGEYQPDSDPGKHLLAHELAHVGRSETTIHRKPLDAAFEDFSLLQDQEVEGEVDSIRAWLQKHPESSAERQVATGTLARYEAEATERVHAERHARLKLVHARPRGTTKVDVAIELTRRALILATDTPPDSDQALDLLEAAKEYLSSFVTDSNIRKHYLGLSQLHVQMIAGGGVGAIDSLQSMIRVGHNQSERGRNGGLWDYHFDRLRIARDYLAILSGEELMTIAQMPVADKLTKAITRAIERLPAETGERVKELLTPEALALMAGFTAVYVWSQVTPVGWLADFLIAGLIVATVYMVGHEAIEIVQLLMKFVHKAVGARSEMDLDEAGEALATAVTKFGVDVALAILLHKAGKSLDLKPPGPRSPGVIELLKTAGDRLTTPQASGWMVTPAGVRVWVPPDPYPSVMEARGLEARPKTASGTGSRGPAPKEPAGPQPSKPVPGQGLSAAATLPKTVLNFKNAADLQNWLGKDLKPLDPLPDGYQWRDTDIQRNPYKKEEGFAPLKLVDGKLAIGEPPARISNASVMNRNYRAAVAQQLQAENPSWKRARVELAALKVILKNSVHHLIPDNVVQDHPVAKAAKKAGYNLDQASNLKGLAKNKTLLEPEGDPGHWTSHPQYDKLVTGELDIAQLNLEKEFGTLDKVPAERLIKEMTKVETKMNKLIDEGKAPVKDGHLSVLDRELTEDDEADA